MQKSLSDKTKKKGKEIIYSSHDLVTVLALERTILAKQRTILAEISVLLGVTGLGLLLFRFYDNPYVKGVGAVVGIVALAMIARLHRDYIHFKKRIKRMDRKNNIFD